MWKIIGYAASAIGVLTGLIALIQWMATPTPPLEISVVDQGAEEIVVNASANPVHGSTKVVAHSLTVDGVELQAPSGALYVANHVRLVNGGGITGPDFAVVATVLEGGKLDSSGRAGRPGATGAAEPSGGTDGGRIVVAAARIDNTAIVADGGQGGDGAPGTDGANGTAGSNGRNGDCAGFGDWEKAQPGGNGGPGGDGGNGQAGGPGGTAGEILLIVSEQPPMAVSATGGRGGNGGASGRYGQGGAGGSGGAGCTGLGGSQNSRSRGADGPDGRPGHEGQPGANGRDGTSTVRTIYFGDVKEAFEANPENTNAFLDALRGLRPN